MKGLQYRRAEDALSFREALSHPGLYKKKYFFLRLPGTIIPMGTSEERV